MPVLRDSAPKSDCAFILNKWPSGPSRSRKQSRFLQTSNKPLNICVTPSHGRIVEGEIRQKDNASNPSRKGLPGVCSPRTAIVQTSARDQAALGQPAAFVSFPECSDHWDDGHRQRGNRWIPNHYVLQTGLHMIPFHFKTPISKLACIIHHRMSPEDLHNEQCHQDPIA